MVSREACWTALIGALVAASAAACGSSAPSAVVAQGSVRAGFGGSSGDFYDDVVPGAPFAWSVRIVNDGSQEAAVDGYRLVGAPPALEILGAAAFASVPLGFSPCERVHPPATADLQTAVASHPLIGSSIGATNVAPWASGGCLLFVLRVPTANDYSVSSVRIQYHVGSQAFEAAIPASLEVCAGAAVPPGAACPFASASPGT
jgi:hypothetical protein